MAPIADDVEYAAAMQEYEAFFDREPEPGSPEAERFRSLGEELGRYEALRWPAA